MLRLNIRHQLPQIGLRIRHSRVNEAHDNQAQININTRRARSNQGATQARIDINSYESRRAYGHNNMRDQTREDGQQGLTDVQAAISAHARESWAVIDNGAKAGDYNGQRARREMSSDINQMSTLVVRSIPDPTTTVDQPSRVVGEIDPGQLNINFDVPRGPTIDITTGSVETYIQNQGFVRQWTSVDRYDIYA